MKKRMVMFLVAGLSTISLVAVVVTIIKHKKLRVHPSTLIAAICLNEAILSWQALLENPSVDT
jgi:hypothetical protein